VTQEGGHVAAALPSSALEQLREALTDESGRKRVTMHTAATIKDDRTALAGLVEAVVERLGREPDLEDFLLWNPGGALEHVVQMIVSSCARKTNGGTGFRCEVFYETSARKANAKQKWSDGAVSLPPVVGIVEVKMAPARTKGVGGAARAVAHDLAALLATNWEATVGYDMPFKDNLTDPDWSALIKSPGVRPWGLVIGGIHGPDNKITSDQFTAAVEAGAKSVVAKYGATCEGLPDRLARALKEPLLGGHGRVLRDGTAIAIVNAWCGPIGRA